MEKELQSGGEIKELADTVDKLSKRLVKDTTAWTNKKENLEADQAACQQACLLLCYQLCCSKPEGCSSQQPTAALSLRHIMPLLYRSVCLHLSGMRPVHGQQQHCITANNRHCPFYSCPCHMAMILLPLEC